MHGRDLLTLNAYFVYDTQADPFDESTMPPFEPTIRNERRYARGASHGKGDLFLTLKVVEAFSAVCRLPPQGLIFLFEEEEIGSPHLRAFLQEHKDLLRADAAIGKAAFFRGFASSVYSKGGK